MITSEQVDKIFPALIKAQSEMGNAKKTTSNPFFKSKYADLAELIEVSKDTLIKNGLAIIQSPGGDGVKMSVTARIIHESGQWIEDSITLTPTKNDPQQAGSAITYARRYQLAALLNIAQEDDDGNTASGKTEPVNVKTIPQDQHSMNMKEIETQSIILEGYITSGIYLESDAVKAKLAIDQMNLANINGWIKYAKKQEAGS